MSRLLSEIRFWVRVGWKSPWFGRVKQLCLPSSFISTLGDGVEEELCNNSWPFLRQAYDKDMNQIIDLSNLYWRITNNKRHLQRVRMRKFGPFYSVKDTREWTKAIPLCLDHSNIFWIRESTYFKKQVIGDLTVSLFADLHGYCLLKQKAL